MFPFFWIFSNWAIFFLRIILGVILVAHGWPKLKNLKSTAEWLSSVGFKPGNFWAPVVAIVEFVGGLLLIVGILVQPISILLIIQFLIINIWKIATKKPLVNGFEFDLLILGAALVALTVETDINIFNLFSWFGLL